MKESNNKQYTCPHCNADLLAVGLGAETRLLQTLGMDGEWHYGEVIGVSEYYCPECGDTLQDALASEVEDRLTEEGNNAE